MPLDPIDADRARDRLFEVLALERAAAARAARPPRIGPDAWRGPAYRAYAARADELSARLHAAVGELRAATDAARTELARALG